MNRKLVTLATLVLAVPFASQGCGGEEEDAGVDAVQSALGAFSVWKGALGAVVPEHAALAKGSGTTLTAYALINSQIWTTTQNGMWSGTWTQLSNGGPAFTSRPSAAAIEVNSGPLFNHFAIVARGSGNAFFITIRNQAGGGIVQDWAAIPAGTFTSSPAITFVPAGSPLSPKNTLVVTGRGGDGRIWEARNTLAGTVYNHASWTGWTPIATQTFISAPAISYACPPTSASPVMFVAGEVSDTTYRFSKFNGTSWSAWTVVQNGSFNSGPALASRTGCAGDFSTETSIFGRGKDDRIYVSTQLSGGSPGFVQVGTNTTTFTGLPGAVGEFSAVNVSAILPVGGGLAVSNNAPSP